MKTVIEHLRYVAKGLSESPGLYAVLWMVTVFANFVVARLTGLAPQDLGYHYWIAAAVCSYVSYTVAGGLAGATRDTRLEDFNPLAGMLSGLTAGGLCFVALAMVAEGQMLWIGATLTLPFVVTFVWFVVEPMAEPVCKWAADRFARKPGRL